MEVKVNREIREYYESVFFGLNLRQLIFSLLAIGAAVGLYFFCREPLGSAVRRVRLRALQRHECRAIHRGMGAVRTAFARPIALQK